MNDFFNEPLSASSIRGALPEKLRGEIYVLDTIDSTNTYAKELALNGAGEGTLVLADEQTAGRGRRGKAFFSPRCAGLYMSLVLRHEGLFDSTQLVTIAAAVAVCRALESLTEIEPQIKWVNDIYSDGRKLCGILCENAQNSAVIVGVGVNCAASALEPELSGIAGAIENGISRNALAAKITDELFAALSLPKSTVLDEYRRRSLMAGKSVRFSQNGSDIKAIACGIGENGDLIVRLESGEMLSISSGEVSVKGTGEWR